MSTSLVQIAANQANALLSTGPRTGAGREAVSLNALDHGLTSTRTVLPGEDPSEFNLYRDSVLETYLPATPCEAEAVDRIASTAWRVRRIMQSEPRFLDTAIREIMEQNPSLSYEDASAKLFTDKKASRDLRLFLRYLTSAERSHAKALAEFKTMQKERLNREWAEAVNEAQQEASAFKLTDTQLADPAPTPQNGSVSQRPHREPKHFFKRRKNRK